MDYPTREQCMKALETDALTITETTTLDKVVYTATQNVLRTIAGPLLAMHDELDIRMKMIVNLNRELTERTAETNKAHDLIRRMEELIEFHCATEMEPDEYWGIIHEADAMTKEG